MDICGMIPLESQSSGIHRLAPIRASFGPHLVPVHELAEVVQLLVAAEDGVLQRRQLVLQLRRLLLQRSNVRLRTGAGPKLLRSQKHGPGTKRSHSR